MRLLDDIHHVTFITSDMDRLIDFYERVFGGRVTLVGARALNPEPASTPHVTG